MLRRIIVVVVMLSFASLWAGTCWAFEKPLGDITSEQQVIDKLFAGRTLDPIEGIWVRDERWIMAIAKASVIYPQDPKYNKYDYIGVNIGEHYNGGITAKMRRTKYNFSFSEDYIGTDGNWKFLSPSILAFDSNGFSLTFVRTYPTP